MSIKIPILLPFDKMEPAYDLEFQPNYITFRTYEKLRHADAPGEAHYYVRDDRVVFCFDVEAPEYEYEFKIIEADYKRLVKMYKDGLK